MKIPKTVWISSTEEEAKRLIQTVHLVKSGLLYANGFQLLPFAHGSDVYLPRLNYSHISTLPYRPYSDELDFSSKKSKKMIRTIRSQLSVYKPDKSISTLELKKAFTKKQKKLYIQLHTFFPDMKLLSQINIIQTLFGTAGSFSYQTTKKKQFSITIWARITGVTLDECLDHITHCIISSLVLRQSHILDREQYKWRHREELIDYLCCHTALRTLFTKPISTTNELDKKDIDHKLLQISKEYYKQWGIANKTYNILIKNNSVYINSKPAGRFSPIETEIIKLLLEKKGTYIAVDEFADTIYPQENEVYTLWSIAKHIQRIRKKFELLGVNPSIIKTKRNFGYRMI